MLTTANHMRPGHSLLIMVFHDLSNPVVTNSLAESCTHTHTMARLLSPWPVQEAVRYFKKLSYWGSNSQVIGMAGTFWIPRFITLLMLQSYLVMFTTSPASLLPFGFPSWDWSLSLNCWRRSLGVCSRPHPILFLFPRLKKMVIVQWTKEV